VSDPEGLLRAYLTSQGTDAVYVGFAVPEQGTPQLPMIVLAQTGGAPDEYGQGSFTVRVECYGETKQAASRLAGQVANALAQLAVQDVPFTSGGQGRIQGGGASSTLPAAGRRLTAAVTAKRYVVLGWIYVTP
jgi:hypothetical protein